MIDTNPKSVKYHLDNTIILDKWTGDIHDRTLWDLIPFLLSKPLDFVCLVCPQVQYKLPLLIPVFLFSPPLPFLPSSSFSLPIYYLLLLYITHSPFNFLSFLPSLSPPTLPPPLSSLFLPSPFLFPSI